MSFIKKIDSYILKRFLVLLVMTFLIVIFILLMQFLWKHFEDLIGKGVGWSVLAELFFYATMTLVPLALPLALLLASLMTFGNLGESFELTAMKSSGISLFRIIRPLIVLVGLIVVAAFFFSNNVLPRAQRDMYTLLFSIRHKSPELDVPTGEFYSGINGVNLYVRGKNGNILKDLMIYDFSNGFNNAMVLLADSGKIQLTNDKKHLLLTLYNGESFENLREQKMSSPDNIPYRRESFSLKEVLYDYDSDFNRYDESLLQDRHISKNIKELSRSIDSIKLIVQERSEMQVQEMLHSRYFAFTGNHRNTLFLPDSEKSYSQYDVDSAFINQTNAEIEMSINHAMDRAKNMADHITYNKFLLGEPQMNMNSHSAEWHRKFSLSFACLIFFFIGAPLGAIIRKGGFGFPVVISVLMFVVYYIIDLTGYKMARENIWEAYQGMWLSSVVLFPIGVFLTYKAAKDATLFNADTYIKLFQKIKNVFLRLIGRSEEEEFKYNQ
jgi:lipopolysaccharide export system permease protein